MLDYEPNNSIVDLVSKAHFGIHSFMADDEEYKDLRHFKVPTLFYAPAGDPEPTHAALRRAVDDPANFLYLGSSMTMWGDHFPLCKLFGKLLEASDRPLKCLAAVKHCTMMAVTTSHDSVHAEEHLQFLPSEVACKAFATEGRAFLASPDASKWPELVNDRAMVSPLLRACRGEVDPSPYFRSPESIQIEPKPISPIRPTKSVCGIDQSHPCIFISLRLHHRARTSFERIRPAPAPCTLIRPPVPPALLNADRRRAVLLLSCPDCKPIADEHHCILQTHGHRYCISLAPTLLRACLLYIAVFNARVVQH
jgi:hypothetical protein